MNTNRFETFYDAVLAIVITILVLKIPQPIGPGWGAFFSIISYGISIFLFSLFPYFASWLSLNFYSLTAETIFGLIILFANISHIISMLVVFGTNGYNEKLKELNIKPIHFLLPIIIILIGFVISYTLYTPGIYLASLFSVFLSIIYNRMQGKEFEDTGRFEALIDAIIAIIITIIVLEIPTAVNGSLASLLELKLEFIAYAVSFIVCFNVWNFTYNLFSIVNKINYRSIWAIASGLFFLSLIPYLTTYVAMNFHDFVPQFLYGVGFIIVNICSFIATCEMKKIDSSNKFLQAAFQNYNNFALNIIFTLVFIIIGYYYYPPIIIISCLFSILVTWIFMIKKINVLNLL